MHTVFVYGSLMKGEQNHGLLAFSRFLEADALPGFVLMGFADVNFPFAKLGTAQDFVVGEVYAVSAPTLASLDTLENIEHHFYERITVELASGRKAFTYIGGETLRAFTDEAIPLGNDWRKRAKQGEPK